MEIIIRQDGSTLINSCPEIPTSRIVASITTGKVTVTNIDIDITDIALTDPCWGEEN
jgi:hypothetical protein